MAGWDRYRFDRKHVKIAAVRTPGLPFIGSLCAVVYAINAIHYGWTPSDRTWFDDVGAWATALALITLYWAGYRILNGKSKPVPLRLIVVPAIVLVATVFMTIPYDSTDVFLYIGVGWEQTHYGLNPYSHVLRDVPNVASDQMIHTDWMRTNKNPWLDLAFVYGFTFALLARFAAWLGNGNWWGTLAVFKLFGVAAYSVTAWIIWRFARTNQERPDITLYLFMWCPLILLHHIANAHNDLLLGCLVVVSFYLLKHRGSMWAPAVLVCATLVKYATLPLLPLVLYFILKTEGWRRAVVSALIALAVVVVLALPYVGEIASFRFDLMAAQLGKVTAGSLHAFIYYCYRAVTPSGLETFGVVLKVALWVVSLGLIGSAMYRFARQDRLSLDGLIATCSYVLFVIILIGSSQFYSWYIAMFLPSAMLLQSDHWLRKFSVLLAGTHVLSVTSLSRKGIGYFLLTTAMALGLKVRSPASGHDRAG